MNVNYLPSFLRELKALRSTPYFKTINTLVFEEIPKLAGLTDIKNVKNVKNLQGYENAYRIKVGDYRIGVIFGGKTVTFCRVLHRKEIYRYFP
jgi:mRNA interferase RelE/StbE